MTDTEPCKHPNAIPTYDDRDFRGLSSAEVRAKFPRFEGQCPDCGTQMIGYSSRLHMLAGDW